MYSQIKGRWFMDYDQKGKENSMLRHDTHYKDESCFWFNWTAEEEPKEAWVSQMHQQTANMIKANSPGPMLSMMGVQNCPSNYVGETPDGHIDDGCGIIGTENAGACNCIYDPVGMVDVPATTVPALAGMKYAGRVLLDLEYDEELGGLYPDYVEMDHYVTYFFHIFMRTDNPTDPNFGKYPIRLASAYAGFAVYYNWKVGDPATNFNDALDIVDTDVWSRGVPDPALGQSIEMPNGPPWTWGGYCNNAVGGAEFDLPSGGFINAGVDVCRGVMTSGKDAFPIPKEQEFEEWVNPKDAEEAASKNSPGRHLSGGHFMPSANHLELAGQWVQAQQKK